MTQAMICHLLRSTAAKDGKTLLDPTHNHVNGKSDAT
jgi:hypothetical protein